MSWKKTLGFVIAAALLAGFYYWYEVKGGEQRQAAKAAAERLFQLNKDAIQAVTITRGKEVIKLAKDADEGWLLTEPVRARTEQRSVEDVLDGLVEGKRERVIAEQADNLADFGLQEPSLTVEATVKDAATPTVLHIGARTPTFSGYYARAGEQPTVWLIPTSLQAKLDKTVFSLRDKTVLALEEKQVKRIEVQHGEQHLAVERDGDGWKLVAPLEAKADKTKITDLISAINGAKVKEFIEETPQDLAKYDLNPPQWRLSFLVGDDRAEKSLLVGSEETAKNGRHAKRGSADNVFLIEAKLTEKFPKEASDWRDRRLLAFERDKVDRVEIVAGEAATEVACVENCGKIPDDRWQLKRPMEAKADAIKVRTLLRNLEELKAKAFVSEAAEDLVPYGLAQPEARIHIWLREAQAPISVAVGREDVDKGGAYVQVAGRPAVYLIETRDRQDIVKTAAELRDRKLLAFKTRDVRKIAVKHPDREVVIEGDGEDWRQVRPTKAKLDGYKVRSLLWKLEDLEFREEWQPTAVAAETYGLEAPAATVTLWVAGDKKVDTLKLGKNVEGKDWIYAQLESSPMLYAVDAKVLGDLPKGTGDI
jgi:hypothetical protein